MKKVYIFFKRITLFFSKTGKLLGEVIDDFVVGGYETNLITDADGELNIVGAAEKKKHDQRLSEFC